MNLEEFDSKLFDSYESLLDPLDSDSVFEDLPEDFLPSETASEALPEQTSIVPEAVA